MSFIFFFNDTATTEIYTLSLHDALPICRGFWRRRFRGTARPAAFRDQRVRPVARRRARGPRNPVGQWDGGTVGQRDRKSTRLNSSHSQISYAVFCLKKKKHANCSRVLVE